MKFTSIFLFILLINSFTYGLPKQNSPVQAKPDEKVQESKIVEIKISRDRSRPKLTLQQAVKRVDAYLRSERLSTAEYFLTEAKYILYGGENELKRPCWFFLLAHESSRVGKNIEILVSMDGKIGRLPSM